jgi:predicted nucleotide-binding protein
MTPHPDLTLNRPRILLADNDEEFLKGRIELLVAAGFVVREATNPKEARDHLNAGDIDLAILDIRLEDDGDDDDQSGLIVAREAGPMIPKLILTGFANVRNVREALRSTRRTRPAAIDVIAKRESFDKLLDAIRCALTRPSVFIVHGHDPLVDSVARLVEGFGVRAVILRDTPRHGWTVIESLERHARVDYAVVLLTPDDVGYRQGHPEEAQGRPRQNVIFELGYFSATLGRERVSVLRHPEVDLLSDYHGVLDIRLDSAGTWEQGLRQALDAAGLIA